MNKGSQEDIQSAVGRTIERVARESYGRLVAYLSVHTRDLASAEDALSEALVKALTTWPGDGLPQNPEAWLLTAARHSIIDVIRHQRVVLASEPTLALLKENSPEANLSTEFPDERLKLLFVCAHPAIDPAMHTPLMLQSEARRSARRALDGRYVPLSEQDPKQWSLPLIEEAERHLADAFKRGRSGRFQLEAAIQSAHSERAHIGRTDWAAIALFYEQLVRISPALGTRVGYAAAVAEAEGPEAGLAVLDPIAPDAVSHYQPYWAVRAHLLQRLGKKREAADAYGRAIGLAEDPAVREFLHQKRG